MIDNELVANVEARHNERCSSYDQCGCFERLLACIRSEPDPEGEFYRWPVLDFNLRDPRLAEWRAMGRTDFTVEERIREGMLVSAEETMRAIVEAGPPYFDAFAGPPLHVGPPVVVKPIKDER